MDPRSSCAAGRIFASRPCWRPPLAPRGAPSRADQDGPIGALIGAAEAKISTIAGSATATADCRDYLPSSDEKGEVPALYHPDNGCGCQFGTDLDSASRLSGGVENIIARYARVQGGLKILGAPACSLTAKRKVAPVDLVQGDGRQRFCWNGQGKKWIFAR